MVFRGLDVELESSFEQDFWRNITSNFVLEYWRGEAKKDEIALEIFDVKTHIVRQDVIAITKGRERQRTGNRFRHQRQSQLDNVENALKIIYFQEITNRRSPDTPLPIDTSIDPFDNPENVQEYIEALRGNDIFMDKTFGPVVDLNVRVINTVPPSLSPSSAPSVFEETKAPTVGGGEKPKVPPASSTVAIWSSVLVCLIALMIVMAIWFFFVHNRGVSNDQCFSICPHKNDNDEEILVDPQGDDMQGLFPIKAISQNDDDCNNSIAAAEEPLHEEGGGSSVSNLVSEGSSNHSRGRSVSMEDPDLTASFISQDKDRLVQYLRAFLFLFILVRSPN